MSKLVVRALYKAPYRTSTFVFLSKDTFNRKCEITGSVYYWSNNQSISPCLFDNDEEALKKLNRLKKPKDVVSDIVIVPFIPGKQIFYTDGTSLP